MTTKNEDLGSSPLNSPSDLTTTTTTTIEMSSKTSAQRVPPPEKPEAIWTRSKVIMAFWAVIFFLGFPIWWKTTSIYRARLPFQEMIDWADGKVGINQLIAGWIRIIANGYLSVYRAVVRFSHCRFKSPRRRCQTPKHSISSVRRSIPSTTSMNSPPTICD